MLSHAGNFGKEDAAVFLGDFAEAMNDCDMMLVGIDGCQDSARIL